MARLIKAAEDEDEAEAEKEAEKKKEALYVGRLARISTTLVNLSIAENRVLF